MKGWVLVTGAGQRIGRAIALELATHGWDIVVHYHKSQKTAAETAEAIHALGRNACLAEIDLSDAAYAENLIPSLAEEIGMIDALVNNAALFDTDEDDPDGTRHMALNADAPRLLSKAFRDHLPKKESGIIVNLLDATPMPPHLSAYAKSKETLRQLTLNMAKSFAPQVRVNGVAPGYVLPGPRQSEEAFLKMVAATPQKTPVSPEEIARAVRRLIESPGLTGEIVTVAGGTNTSAPVN
ncbi:MAG: SDR family NAD(P)-dependent oxidoreductase [Alphaproteobacteria bacterium]|nr:SDR family NAD(P)-dependent oxidoreductase [Alphaproteobacteria bacterium]